MICLFCNIQMHEIKTAYQATWGEYRVTLDELKALQCPGCCRLTFKSRDARLIQNITAGLAGEKPGLMTAGEVACLLRVSGQTVYNMLRDGRLNAVKVGREWRFPREEVLRSLHRQTNARNIS